MWSPRRVSELELRTRGETIYQPAGRVQAERNVGTEYISDGDVGAIIADVDPISNIYDDSRSPPE